MPYAPTVVYYPNLCMQSQLPITHSFPQYTFMTIARTTIQTNAYLHPLQESRPKALTVLNKVSPQVTPTRYSCHAVITWWKSLETVHA